MISFDRASVVLLAVLAALVSSACTATTEDAETDDEALSSLRPIRLATFNAGLVRGGVALVDERLPNIAPALQATGADVLCLDEVWSDEDYEKLRAALAPTHPNAFRQRTEEKGTSWFECSPIKLLSLKSCVDGQCTPSGISAEECVQTACKASYGALSDDCKICLAANTDSPTSCAFWSNDFVQKGRNGLALFSRYPIGDARFHDYGTALVHRGLIRATIEGRAIACTHLTSDLTTVPYPKGHPFSSWREEQASEVDKVTAALPASGCRIVMGDLNASPDAGVIRPEIETTLASFAERGFREPWEHPACTWCPPPANPLASGRDEKWYDHILLKGCGKRATYTRIMDQPLQVHHEGTTLTTSLSDHFGIMVDLGR